ncbi:MAG: sigma-70 family RNA polymerase sigma factor [Clostridia bacterium]|nr:sigma-70 family RNA polymerase sigma factor [Clostridia bacterium]
MTRDETLSEWLMQYGDLITRTCCLYLGDRTLAEDAAQDTFIRAWKSMAQFSGRNNATPKSWLVRIAINVCRNYRRTAWFRRTDRSVTLEELPLAAAAEDRMLLLTVQALPDRYRQVIILRYYHGMSLEETARTLGLSRSTAYHRLQKALKALRIELDPDEKGGAASD